LDGLSGKGNRAVFATFDYQGRKWQIQLDTSIVMLLLAWEMLQAGKKQFVQRETKAGFCLRLNEGQPDKARGLYIYSVG